jgi:hypothetical protein
MLIAYPEIMAPSTVSCWNGWFIAFEDVSFVEVT